MLDYALTVNGTDLTKYIKYDSYSTNKTPMYADPITTLDGVQHTALIRSVGSVTFELNPQNATDTQTIASALLTQPCAVKYFSLQTQQYEERNMKLTDQSAEYLVKCKFQGLKWNQIGKVTLVEL